MTDQQKRSIQQRWNELQPSKTMLVWSCLGAVVVALVVGFTWGGWVTGGTARDMAETAGDESRYALASAICVEKFLAAPDARARLTELKAIDSSYRQRQFIEEGGWRPCRKTRRPHGRRPICAPRSSPICSPRNRRQVSRTKRSPPRPPNEPRRVPRHRAGPMEDTFMGLRCALERFVWCSG